MSPQRPDFILSTHIPDIEFNILVCDRLDVKSHGRNGCDVLIQLQLIQDRCLARSVESQHQQAHFFRSEDLAHHFGDLSSHCSGPAGSKEEAVLAFALCARGVQLGRSFVCSREVVDARP